MGRDEELGALRQLRRGLDLDGLAVVWLVGEAGVGKTALIREFIADASAQDESLHGKAAEFERDVPFAVFSDALESYGQAGLTDALAGLGGDETALLATVFPWLATGGAGTNTNPTHSQRGQLLHALHKVLAVLADRGPLTMALDDLHWADPASIDMICRLLNRGLAERSLLVLATRPGPSELRIQTALGEAERHGEVLRIELPPLSRSAAQELIGGDVSPSLANDLYRESGGNPFYLEQLVTLGRRGSSAPTSRSTSFEPQVPDRVRVAIELELNNLPAIARQALQYAALLGDPFDADLLAATSELDGRRLFECLDLLLDRDLIRATTSPRSFRFRHPIVRHAVYESTSAGWRLEAHGDAARALESRGAPASARATHIERSAKVGDQAAIGLLSQAGMELMSQAPASAAHWLGAAIDLFPGDEGLSELRAGLMAQRALTLFLAGRLEDSRSAFGDFLRVVKPESREMRAQATVYGAVLDELLGDHLAGRQRMLRELKGIVDQRSAEAADIKRELACTHIMDGEWEEARRWSAEALDTDCSGILRVGALAVLGTVELCDGDPMEGRRLTSEAGAAHDRLGDDEIGAHSLHISAWLAGAELCDERVADSLRHIERTLQISLGAGAGETLVAPLLSVQGQALELLGRVDELCALAETVTDAALLSQSELNLCWAMTIRSRANLLRGDLRGAVRCSERAASASAAMTNSMAAVARVQLAEVSLETGQPELCREHLLSPSGEVHVPAFPPYWGVLAHELLARAEIALGDLRTASDFAERARDIATRMQTDLSSAFAHRASALVDGEGGDMRSAIDHGAAACQAAERAGAPIEAGRSEIIHGRGLASLGDRVAARQALRSAHERLHACGALRYSDEAAKELRALGSAVPRARGRSDNGDGLGLSNREREVLELIASGNTNREIGELLFISARTVDRHVARIFEKLGVKSRAAACSVFERARVESLP